MRILQLQTRVHEDKRENITQLRELMDVLVKKEKPDLVTLGEMFTCPYETQNFPVYAEKEGGETYTSLSKIAREYQVYLSAGTIPEVDSKGKIYNTAYVFDRKGMLIGKYRKMHLFDIDIKGGQSFRESDTLTAGDECTVFDTEFGRMGISICFDIRFPEISRLMALKGAKVILVPAAFNMTTGPAHWDLHFRARAVDDQCYYIGTSPARDDEASYRAWGHSIITSPWGEVVSELDEKPGYAILEIDLSYVYKIRRELPLLSARREDRYILRLRDGDILP